MRLFYKNSHRVLQVFILFLIVGCSEDEKSIEVKDMDGNVYTTVKIGSQIWMAENLKTTKYNDGTSIPNVTGSWYLQNTSAYSDYDDDPIFSDEYGRIYNYYAVRTGKLCPKGWHVPTKPEWEGLLNHFNDKFEAATRLKESGGTHWINSSNGTNESGFSALPSGFKTGGPCGVSCYSDRGYTAWWWSSTEFNSDYAYFTQLEYAIFVGNYDYYNSGYCVRCIKD